MKKPDPDAFSRALVGVSAGMVMMAVAEALAALLRFRVGPLGAVAELIRDLAPSDAVKGFISLVGAWDKPLLIAAVVLGALAVSASAGFLRWGALVLVGLGGVGSWAVLAEAGRAGESGTAPLASLVPPVVASAVGVACFQLLREARADAVDRAGRRRFLRIAALVGLGAGAAALGGRWWGRARRSVEEVRARLRLDVSAGRVPAGAELDVEGLGPWRVPGDRFYRIDTAFSVPLIDPDDWELRIHGMVDRTLTLSFEDLLARERTEAWATLACVSNEVGGNLIGNAWWSGTRVADLLAEAGVDPDADAVLQTSSDGWTCGTPIEALTDERDALVAYAMNGEPLPIEHGFPVRMIVPGLYGYVSATKWVVDLEVTRFADIEAYWTRRGWSERGPIKTQSRVLVPSSRDTPGAGEVVIAGDAWAQRTGIDGVEIQVDGGDWLRCDLAQVPNRDTWVQWSRAVHLAAGDHVVVVRATDRTGQTQTSTRVGVVPDGATGWDEARFTVRSREA